jgi:PAS domain S-box-containing protein
MAGLGHLLRQVLRQLFTSGNFEPHGYCYLWKPGLVWLHVISDSLIAGAYFAIPIVLLLFVRRRRDLPFSWMFALFGVFIVACGSTHLMEVWNLWHGNYWLAGVIKAVTAAASVPTAILLAHLMPQTLDLPNYGEWIRANAALKEEIAERREVELNLRISEANYREQAELLDLTHDAIFARNFDGKIFYWNRGAEQLYGWHKEEAHGKSSHELLQTQFPAPLGELMASILEKGYWEGELVQVCRGGSRVTVSSRWALRRDAAGEPVSILESNRDITQRKKEEARFRNLLEAAPDAMVIVDSQGLIQLVNAQTERLFGYSRAELIGQRVEILVPSRYQGRHAADREGYARSPHARSMGAGLELYGRRKDGSEFPVEVSLSPLETSEGTLISSAIRDITERKKTEEALQEKDEKLRLLVRGVKDYAILMLDPDGRITNWSEAAERIKGYCAEEIIGEHFSKFYTPEAIAQGKPARELKIAAAEGRFEEEGWRVRKDGSRFWANVVVTSLRDKTGRLRGFGKVTRDITERKRAAEEAELQRNELARTNAELVTVNSELESFSYSVSHDLRAPLRHIDGFARILKDEHASMLSEDGIRYLDRVLQAATHMGRLVDDLLNLARIGRKEISRQMVKLDDLVREAMADLPPEIVERHIEWRIEPLGETSCDPGLLKLVLVNLLSNAVKFTKTRQLAVIEVGTRQAGGVPIFFIRDNGVGFDPKYADKLFGVFQRLHRQEDFAGTGIGLATVQRIIHRHGGQVWAESEPDRGATFFFSLEPCAQSRRLESIAEVKLGHIGSR